MSKYGFAIKSAADLLEKAKHDAERFNREGNDAVTWSYAAMDYIQTAWHLADWIASESGESVTKIRSDIDAHCSGMFMLLGDIACGQKHWHRDGKNNPPQVAAKTTAPPLKIGLSALGLAAAYHESPYVIDKHGRKVYAQILIRDTLEAITQFVSDGGMK